MCAIDGRRKGRPRGSLPRERVQSLRDWWSWAVFEPHLYAQHWSRPELAQFVGLEPSLRPDLQKLLAENDARSRAWAAGAGDPRV